MYSFARRLFLTVLAASLSYPAWGQSPARLVADLVPGPGNSSSYPRQAVEVDGALYFVATHPLTGREVWRWDGNAPARPLEVCPGRCSSDPQVLRPFGDRLVFVASGVGDDAREALWIAGDGRPRWLHDVGVWDESSRLEATSSLAYFTVRGEGGGLRLLSSDGTVEGTGPVAGTQSWQSVRSLTAMGDRLFVVAENAGVLELWTIADHGSPMELKTVSRRSGPGWTASLPRHGGAVYFAADEASSSKYCEVWRSDGTVDGTVLWTALLRRGNCGVFLDDTAFLDNGVLTYFVEFSGYVVLSRTDGTQAGTFELTPRSYYLGGLVPAGDRAFFNGSGLDTSFVLVTDGTVAGTHLAMNGDTHYAPGVPVPFGNGAVFSAYNSATGRALWFTDGAANGTRLVADVDPEVRPTMLESLLDFEVELAAFDGRLVFPGFARNLGEELWVTDGTPEGTELAADVNPGVASSAPGEITPAWDPGLQEDVAVLRAGGQVWRTAGDGVFPLTDVADPPDQLLDLTPAAGRVFAKSYDGELRSFVPEDWSSELAGSFDCPPTGGAELGGRFLFVAHKNASYFLWASDGTAAGTVQVTELPMLSALSGPAVEPAVESCPPMPTVRLGERLYILAPHHLLATDGTLGGTFDLLPTEDCDFFTCWFRELVEMGGDLDFTRTREDETVLWRGSGELDELSRLATVPVLPGDVAAGGPKPRIRGLTVVGERLYFVTETEEAGETLWTSDGTPGGTRMLRSLAGFEELTAAAGRLFFSADDGVHGQELWTSDATADGTRLVTDIAPGPEPSLPRSLREIDGRLVFAADDGVHGHEVWTSDGTMGGSRLVADVEAEMSSSPYGFTAVGDDVLFGAGTAAEGFELWALPRDALTEPEEGEEPEDPPCPDDTACLAEGRFTVTVHWRNPRVEGAEGDGHPLPFSDESSLFWFFSEGNVELIVKILDGRRQNGHFWVFYGGLSDVEYWITVTDTETSRTRTYHNPPGEICGGADVRAFATDGS